MSVSFIPACSFIPCVLCNFQPVHCFYTLRAMHVDTFWPGQICTTGACALHGRRCERCALSAVAARPRPWSGILPLSASFDHPSNLPVTRSVTVQPSAVFYSRTQQSADAPQCERVGGQRCGWLCSQWSAFGLGQRTRWGRQSRVPVVSELGSSN